MGCPLRNNSPRGLGRDSPSMCRIDRRMTSASEMSACEAARFTATLRSSGKYTVVFSTNVWYYRWRRRRERVRNMVRQGLVGPEVHIGDTGLVFMADGSAESRTRDHVRRAVGATGPVTARELAVQLDLTPAAVRRHLDALAEEGAIVEREMAVSAPRGRGRPARAFVLTDRGQEHLQTSYDDVATAALHYLADRAGDGAVAEFAETQMAVLEERLRLAMAQADTQAGLDERATALAEALTDEGFAASVRPVGEGTGLAGLQLCQGHCPVRHVASEFHEFCEAETDVISRVLGVHVQRLATLAGGEHVCTTFVPTGPIRPVATLAEGRDDAAEPPYRLPQDQHPNDIPQDRSQPTSHERLSR